MNSNLNDYILSHIDPEPEHLNRLYRDTNLHLLYPHMCSGHLQGRVLRMITSMIAPRHVLELGTYSGYSALCMAEALADDACSVDTIEIDDEAENFIRNHLRESSVGNRVNLIIGDATEVVPTLPRDYQLVFIDANKRQYVQYYQLVFPHVVKGGFIIVDNTLWDSKVSEQENHDALTDGVRAFNDYVAADTRVSRVILPLRDGLTIIQKLTD